MAAMEMGASAVLVNTAIATAKKPAAVARAFNRAVNARRDAYPGWPTRAINFGFRLQPLTAFLQLMNQPFLMFSPL